MTIADKLALLASTKERLRTRLKVPTNIPFAEYPNYINWKGVADIPTNPVYADFANERYAKNGKPCSFAGLFAFSRAGKAWLVTDTGLQEYAANEPRFDNGLLIEQTATNFLLHTNTPSNEYWTKSGVTVSGSQIAETTADRPHALASPSRSVPQYNHARSQSMLIKPMTARYIGLNVGLAAGSNGHVIIDTQTLAVVEQPYDTGAVSSVKVRKIGELIEISYVVRDSGVWSTGGGSSVVLQFYRVHDFILSSRIFVGNPATKLELLCINSKVENNASSFIPSTTSPVTRPADYLSATVTGTTVTGDWDSTLSLSIVDGQLVHSGYGRIRRLEIN